MAYWGLPKLGNLGIASSGLGCKDDSYFGYVVRVSRTPALNMPKVSQHSSDLTVYWQGRRECHPCILPRYYIPIVKFPTKN